MPIPMAKIDWFPKAQSKLITARFALANVNNDDEPTFNTVHDAPLFQGKYASLWPAIKWGENASDVLPNKQGYNNCHKVHPEKPAMTLPKRQTGRGFATIVHWKECRPLTIAEAKRLQSFPDGARFIGRYSEQWAQIGNSVPPLFMRAIASHVTHLFLGRKPMRPAARTNYLDILKEAWQQHLELKTLDAPTVISTFAGCGGSSLGYSMAGYRELLAVEWDDKAVATFRLNFPDVLVYHGDIRKLTAEECLKLVGLKTGELDLLDSSPPCQGFSSAGKRQMDDIRNQLSFEFIRLLRGIKPKVFVMENVSGLVKGKMKLIFAEIMRELKASGYQVRCKLLNAMYFHVPQSRQRLIWIGVRNDWG